MKVKQKPSERIHRRYILLDSKNKKEVEEIILEYLGLIGWARASPIFLNENGKVILAVERKSLIDIRAAIELSEKNIKIIRVSGTIASLKRKV